MTTRPIQLDPDRGQRVAWWFALAGTALGGFVAGNWLNGGVGGWGAPGTSGLLGMLAGGAVLLLAIAAGLWLRRRAAAGDGTTLDPATGLFTRDYADTVIPGMMARDDRGAHGHVALIMLSIDFLDDIEQRHGPAAVAEVMAFAGRQVAGQTRAGDVPVRFDTRRLAVFLHCEEIEQAVAFGRRVSMLLAGQQLDCGGEVMKLTSCMGMVLREDGESLQALEARAEQKLLEAQRAGCNQILA